MRELENIKVIANALDVTPQLERALQLLKDKGFDLQRTFFDGFYGMHLDLQSQIEKFQRDYSGSSLVVFVLSLYKDHKHFVTNEKGERDLVDSPAFQEKVYLEPGEKENITTRDTNFFSVKYLSEVAEKVNLKLETIEFGATSIHISMLYFDNKPVEISVNPELEKKEDKKVKDEKKVLEDKKTKPDSEKKEDKKLKLEGDKE